MQEGPGPGRPLRHREREVTTPLLQEGGWAGLLAARVEPESGVNEERRKRQETEEDGLSAPGYSRACRQSA